MGLVNAVYNWPSVKALCLTVFSMNLAGVLALALAILWAVRFERGFGDYLNLVAPGDGHAWTVVIILAAVCCSPAYYLGIKSSLYLKLEPAARGDLEDRHKLDDAVDPHDANRLLFVHVLACLLSGFLVAILNATYLALLSGFQQKSRDGLAEAIEKYTSDVATKARVDAVQTELECCGDNSYEDWFRVPWLKVSIEGPEDVEKGPRLEEQSVTEEPEEDTTPPVDVPFSCCSNDIPKPCVHHDILSSNAVYKYDPKHLTISTKGCRSRIISRGELIKTYLAGYLALLSVYQMVLSLMSRLLQTAHSNELYIGPRKTRYHVWIFFRPDDFPVNERRDEEPRPRRKHARRSKQKLSASFATSSDEEETSTQRRRNEKSSSKILTKIRSKISSVKSKSLPVIRSRLRSSNSRGKTRSARKLEDQIDQDEERELLSNHVTKSDIVTKKNRKSVYSLISDNSSTTELPSPPPPPPPPFVVTLDMESEQDQGPVETVPSKSFKAGLNAVKRNLIVNQNSGRRVKVLERFVKIWNRNDRATQHRESGGADDSNSSRRSSRTNCSRRKVRAELSSTDIYDRFRGSLQHTLARRDAIRARNEPRKFSRPIVEEGFNHEDVKRSNVLARLQCNNVPPSYRLLAECDVHKRAVLQTHPVPPPPPPPLPPPPNTWSRDSARIRERKPPQREQRQCSICNRPVQQSLSSSRESLVETREDARVSSSSPQRKAAPAPFLRHKDYPRGDYASWNRSTSISKPIQRR